MGVHVEHGLSGVDSGVEDQTEGAMELLVGDFLRHFGHVGELCRILFGEFGDVRAVARLAIERIAKDTSRDRYLVAAAAKEYGLVDEIVAVKRDKKKKPAEAAK